MRQANQGQTTPKPRAYTRIAYTLGMAACIAAAHADAVYRCGSAYSPAAQCPNGQAAEAALTSKSAGIAASNSATAAVTQDQREADALEKKRLQAERQATQNAPVRMSESTYPNSPIANQVASPNTPPTRKQGKHTRKLQGLYFTAKDPNAPPKKKSTAKAVPASVAN